MNAIKNFLVNSDETGRHIIYSMRTGKRYFVEPIGNGRGGDWGWSNKTSGKYTGSIIEKESIITTNNGFNNIETVVGNPYQAIIERDKQYPTL